MLVTHFMEEAERLCDRIAVMDRGKVVALDSPRGLVAAHAAGLRVVFHTDAADVSFLEGVRHVEAVHRDGPRVVVEGRDAVLAHVAAALVAQGIAPADLHVEAPSLEDVFLEPDRACHGRMSEVTHKPREATAAKPGSWALTFVEVLLRMTWIEIKLLIREPVTLVFSFAFPVLVLVLLGGIFGGQHMDGGAYAGLKMMDWYVPSYIGLVIASIGTVSLPVHLSTYRERGVLRRFRASGVSEWALLGSQFLVGVGTCLVGALAISVLGIFAYGVVVPVSIGGVAVGFVVGGVRLLGARRADRLAGAHGARRAGRRPADLVHHDVHVGHQRAARASCRRGWWPSPRSLPLYHVVICLVDPWNGYGINLLQATIVGGIGLATTLLAAALFLGLGARRVAWRRRSDASGDEARRLATKSRRPGARRSRDA